MCVAALGQHYKLAASSLHNELVTGNKLGVTVYGIHNSICNEDMIVLY